MSLTNFCLNFHWPKQLFAFVYIGKLVNEAIVTHQLVLCCALVGAFVAITIKTLPLMPPSVECYQLIFYLVIVKLLLGFHLNSRLISVIVASSSPTLSLMLLSEFALR